MLVEESAIANFETKRRRRRDPNTSISIVEALKEKRHRHSAPSEKSLAISCDNVDLAIRDVSLSLNMTRCTVPLHRFIASTLQRFNELMRAELGRAERRVEEQSAALKKRLGLRDLVLTQIVFIVGSSWVGTAAKLGTSHLCFWLLAILLFYIPQAAVVIYLSRLMPLDGGFYYGPKFTFTELAGILAGEAHSPARNIGRSVLIASPVIALMFILGTSSVLALIGNNPIDLIGPVPQTLRLGLQSFSAAATIASVGILLMTVRTISSVSIHFTGSSRLPMVAGWDDLLPTWFSRLHARYKTPINSITFVGAVTLVI